MAKTNLDDLDLATAGIEADEISVEGAMLGQALIAGATAGLWGEAVSIACAEHASEDSLTSGAAATAMESSELDIAGNGWSLDEDGNLVAGEELDGRKMLYLHSAGLITTGKVGYFGIQMRVQHEGNSTWYTFPEFRVPLADNDACAIAIGFGLSEIHGGDKFKTSVRMYSTTGGSGDLNLDMGRTIIAAL